jgi:hypothetical protein
MRGEDTYSIRIFLNFFLFFSFNSRTGMGTGACCLKELGVRRCFTAVSRAFSCSRM